EICGAALIRWRHAVPDRFDSFSHRYSLQRVIRGLAQSAYDRIGGALGCKQSVPTGDDEFGKPLFGDCREVRQNGTPICSHKCNRLDRIALYLRHPRIDRLANEIDAAGNEILHRYCSTAIWDVGYFGSHRVAEHEALEMGGGASTRGRKLHPGVIGPCIGDKLWKRDSRKVLACNKNEERSRDHPDWLEIGRGVIKRFLVECLIDRMCTGIAKQNLIAIGWGFCDARCGRHTARAADILNDHLLP